jgi:predicted dehydrogenase
VGGRNTRRDFLKGSAAAAAGVWLSGQRVWGSSTQPANEKLGIAVVGIGGQGAWNVDQLVAAKAAVVALCDVDERMTGHARKACPSATFYRDFRVMLDKQGKDIDAVLVATPDNTHALITLAALNAGKHVYCEKPLTYTVEECRKVIETARRTKRVTQMGTQNHASENYRRVVELVQSGAIGPVREVHSWCPTVWSGGGDRPTDTPPVPPELSWDLWVGPAPFRPYNPAYLPSKWRGWWDFGGGGHSDMACHLLDLVHWALELKHPLTVEAEGPPVHPESAPDRLTVRYEYPARGEKPPVKVTWCVGVNRPDNFDAATMPAWDMGVLFVGEKGMLAADYGQHKLLPEKQFEGFTPRVQTIAPSLGHHAEWIHAIKTGGRTLCNFDYSGVLAETVLLGNVAYRSGRKIEYDAKTMRIPNAPEAEKFLRRTPRAGWSV